MGIVPTGMRPAKPLELVGDRPRKSLVKRHFAHSEDGFRGARPQRFNNGAFEYSRRQLELAGVTTLKEFSEIKHSIRTQEYRARLKALESKRGGAAPTTRSKNGILQP